MKTSKFKMTEVGTIPDGWSVVPLGDLFSFKNGYNTSAECYGAGTPVASVLEALDWMPVMNSRIRTKVKAPEGARCAFSLRQGDLIFTRSSETLEDVGRSNVYVDDEPAMFGGFIIRGRPKTRNNSRFINFLLKDQKHHERVMSQGAGAQHYNIGQTGLAKVLITLPPLAEQEKIAEALSDVDELISALGKLIEKKRAIRQGAIQELLGMRNEECGMRNVPRRRLAGFSGAWVEKRFDDCFELIGNNTYARECMCDDCDGLANIHYGDVLIRYGAVLDCSREAVPSLINSIICRTDRLSDGDVIIADTAEDETVGKAIEIRGLKGRRAVSGLHTIACRPRFDFAPGWLGYYINSSAFHDQLLPLITGTKVSSISKAGLRATILNVPTLAEQKAIAAVLSDMDAEIAALEADRTKYERIKSGMMQELLTGKTRLKQ